MKAELITSLQNPKIKNLVKLSEKSSERRSQNLIIVEGLREIQIAIEAGFHIEQLYFCEALGAEQNLLKAKSYFEISKEVFSKIAYREGSDGYIAVFEPVYFSLDNLKLPSDPFIIILESVEKPGNLGAILRTADAANIDALIVCDPKTDIYNPNAIRSSVGCVFSVPIVTSTNQEVLDWLRNKNINTYAAALTATKEYTDVNFKESSAIVMGTEAIGLTSFWLNNADAQIKIPMLGKIDSLNVSTSTAILTFEALRQRRKN